LRWRAPSRCHVLRNGGLADIDAELEELSMDAGSAPERIGEAHLADQPPNFRRYAGPARTPTRFPAPEAAKASSVPAEDGLRLNDRKCIQNARCNPVQADEKDTVKIACGGHYSALAYPSHRQIRRRGWRR
jgi:hypothetical protein